MSLLLFIKKIENSRWRYPLVFIAFFAIFLLFHSVAVGFSSSDDPYYHAKHSLLMVQSVNLTLLEPWIEPHFLNYAPTDPWWGYHLLLAGTIAFFGPIWGSKVLSALLAALAILVFYIILNVLSARRPLVWTFLFFSSSAAFLYRLLLHRPHLLSVVLLPLIYILASRRRYWWLFALSILYTLFYQLAPLSGVIVIVYLFVYWHQTREFDLKLLIANLGGILVGVILHPQAFNYLYVMFLSLWQVSYLRLAGINLDVGGEARAVTFLEWLRPNLAALGFYVAALAISVANFSFFKKQKKRHWLALGVLSIVWFVVSLLMRRGVEYWQPFAWLFIAVTLSMFATFPEWCRLKYRAGFLWGRIARFFIHTTLMAILLLNVIWVLLVFVGDEPKRTSYDFYFRQAAEWLSKNTVAGEVVFYNNWSFWPIMFYYNDRNRYLAGMDPTFLYEYDPKLFWIWRNISWDGVYCDQPEPCLSLSPRESIERVVGAIRNKFRARWVLLNNNADLPLYKILTTRQQDFRRVYENKGLIVFKIIK